MSGVGTRQYQAPEVLEGKAYTGTKVDVFSIGVIIFVMVTGALPYYKEASTKDPIYKFLCSRQYDKFWQTWRDYRDPTGEYYQRQVSTANIVNDALESVFSLVVCFVMVMFRLAKTALCFSMFLLSFCRKKCEPQTQTGLVFSDSF